MVAGYAQPDPLVLEDGEPVLDADTWINIFNLDKKPAILKKY